MAKKSALFTPDYRDFAVMAVGYARLAAELKNIVRELEAIQEAPIAGAAETLDFYQQRRDQAFEAAQELVDAQP